jgi:hypothetical protein
MSGERVVGLRYVARGIGGVEEMRSSLDDSRVYFGLLRFVFGRGTFARVKTLMVHWNGSRCPVVRRGRANASKPLVEVRATTRRCDDEARRGDATTRRDEALTDGWLE